MFFPSIIVTAASSTPGAEGGTLEWVIFLFEKYGHMFVTATWMTIYIAIVGTLLGFLVGFFSGVVQTTKVNKDDFVVKRLLTRALKLLISVYVEIFRDTPMIVQGMIIYYGLRQNNIEATPVMAGILVTVLNTGAYMGETVRGGINSVDSGQEEGALAMGMSHVKAMIYVIIPQAFKNVIPEMGNTLVNNLKMTSVLNVIGVSELFLMAKTAGGTYYRYYEAYLDIAAIYLVLCFVLNRVLAVMERKMQGKSDYVLATEYMDNE